MNKILLSNLIFNAIIFPVYVFAQIEIIDESDRTNIPFVRMISKEGDILGISNIDGIITFDDKNLFDNKKVSFYNPSYEVCEITLEKVNKQIKILT